jgi:glutathione peroxidase-family protein
MICTRPWLRQISLFVFALLSSAFFTVARVQVAFAQSDFYQLRATTLQGEEFPFENLKGKVVLFVNTASKCGFTPQYEGLQKVFEKYQSKGLAILAFPSNQFGSQEPGDSAQIASFCKLNYGVTFPVFQKGNVKEPEIQPVYKFLMDKISGSEIGWNFEKILVSRAGEVLTRFKSSVEPESKELIEQLELALNS